MEHGIVVSQENITPELAKLYLSNQRNNRNVLQSHVKNIVKDMVEGRWKDEADPIKFTASGQLIDGQHRLNAVVVADRSQKFVVLRGYTDDSMGVLDIGKPRSAAHVGQIIGLDITAHHTACINALNLPLSNDYRSTPEILDIWGKYEKSIIFACKSYGTYCTPNSVLRALLAKAYYYENTKTLESFARVFGGERADAGQESAYTLQKIWNKMKEESKATMTYNARVEWYNKCQQALQYFIKGVDAKRIVNPPATVDLYPLPGIQPDTPENLKRFKSLNSYYKQS